MRKKLSLEQAPRMTLVEGCNKYLENCRQRNLSEMTILHYGESYQRFYKLFGKTMLLAKK